MKNQFVAFRGKHKWVQVFEHQKIENQNNPSVIKQKGSYLITGGVGGIGLVFARYLVENYKAKVILTSRTAFPPRKDWENYIRQNESDKLSKRIKKVIDIEKSAGSKIEVMQMDVADINQMKDGMTRIIKACPDLNGVIHMAGNPGGGIIQSKEKDIV